MQIDLSTLQQRAARLNARLSSCELCPRRCAVSRLDAEMGYCHSSAQPIVASCCAHMGEEPAISGVRGSGTIFFANCNLRCVFCQNYQISQDWQKQQGNVISIEKLAQCMLSLQEMGCHNISFVSPSHFVPQIVQALTLAVPRGLELPLVYNTNGYDSLETLRELDGIIDVYLPDLKYADADKALKYSDAPNYVSVARAAIREMYRQVGKLQTDDKGIALRGVIVRHLLLPHDIAGSRDSLNWLACEVSPDVSLSLMSQYHPTHKASAFPEINRRINRRLYDRAVAVLDECGLENGWVQGMESPESYLPDFDKEGHPFEIN
ncbi:MAG: radical SAM protein [Dehalococcoidia bacterium]|nr:radical SAM protein [Dehalococcoidia bacterium]